MKSIKHEFDTYKVKHPDLADFTLLMKTVRGQKYSKDALTHWFKTLVPNDDYSNSDKKALIHALMDVTNMVEDRQKETQISTESPVKSVSHIYEQIR